MKWYEWVFDGVGTAIIGLISGLISYKAAVKKMSRQYQQAGNDSKQKQKILIGNSENKTNVQNNINQTQKAGNRSEQIQFGEINEE